MNPISLHSLKRLALAGIVAACFAVATPLHATDVTLIVSTPAGQSWLTPSVWSDGQAAHAGNEYFVGKDRSGADTVGTSLRCPAIGDGVTAVFPGDALYINTRGTLAMKPSIASTTATMTYQIDRLEVNGGSFSNATGSSLSVFTGNMKCTLHVTVNNNVAADSRRAKFANSIDGDGTITLNMLDGTTNDDQFTLAAPSNTHTGVIVQKGGTLFLSTPQTLGTVKTLQVLAPGRLEPTVDLTAYNTALDLSTTATMVLNTKVHFKAATINGTPLAEKTYTGAELAASYPNNIVNGGGSLTIGPPPNAIRRGWLYE